MIPFEREDPEELLVVCPVCGSSDVSDQEGFEATLAELAFCEECDLTFFVQEEHLVLQSELRGEE